MCLHDTQNLPKLTAIAGRRWFDRKYGNTYHAVTLCLSDGTTRASQVEYGYGDQYIQTAMEFAAAQGVLPEPTPEDFVEFTHGRPVNAKTYSLGNGWEFSDFAADFSGACFRCEGKEVVVPFNKVLFFDHTGGCMQYSWQWRKAHGISATVADVPRKKDL